MEYISLAIVIVCVYAAFSDKVHTDGTLLHLLWAAATFSACGVIGSPLGMIFGLLFTIAAGTYYGVSELNHLFSYDDELEE